MRRPCAFSAVALISGIVAGKYLAAGLLVVLPAAAVLIVVFLVARPVGYRRVALLFALIAFAGAAYLDLRTSAPESSDVSNFVRDGPLKAPLTGRILTPPTRVKTKDDTSTYRFDLAARKLEIDGEGRQVSGTVRVYLTTGQQRPSLDPGNIVRIQAKLYPLPRPTNPGQVDYTFYYEKRNISARAYLREGALEVIGRKTVSWPRRTLFAVRQRILDGFETALGSGEDTRLLGALLVGERAALDEETQKLYFRTGTFHFFALSGLHVAIFAFFLWYTLALLPVPRNIRIGIVMAGLILYCVVGGARISLVRATVMGLLYLGAELLWRQRDTLNILGASAVVIILIDPMDIFGLGFQLSFVAVLSIVAFGPLYGKLRTIRGYLLLTLQKPEERTGFDRVRVLISESFVVWASLSFSAWVGVAPLVAYHFHIVTPFSILLNIVISPAIWALLIMGILTAVCSLIVPPAAPALAFVVSLLIGGIQTILALFSSQPFYFYVPNGFLPPASPVWLILYYALLTGVALRLRYNQPKWRHLTIGALVLVGLFLLVPWRPSRLPGTRLVALDVGRGSAFVLRTSGGATVLYDCGGYGRVGQNVIAPYLWHVGITTIDAVILSHPDADHTCALPDLFERFRVGAVIVSSHFARNEEGERLLEAVRSWSVPVVKVAPGQQFEVGGARFEVLAPTTGEALGRELSDNDTSLIVRMLDAGSSVLFTGDAEARETAILLGSGADLDCSVLIVPHHGGRNPLISQLARRSRARTAVISGGYNQAQVVKELESLGLRVLTTERAGAITIRRHEEKQFVDTFHAN